MIYSLDQIFDDDQQQQQHTVSSPPDLLERIALPLVRNLVEHKNSLLVLNGINESAEMGCSRRGDQDETLRLFQLVLEVLLRPIENGHRTKVKQQLSPTFQSNLFLYSNFCCCCCLPSFSSRRDRIGSSCVSARYKSRPALRPSTRCLPRASSCDAITYSICSTTSASRAKPCVTWTKTRAGTCL